MLTQQLEPMVEGMPFRAINWPVPTEPTPGVADNAPVYQQGQSHIHTFFHCFTYNGDSTARHVINCPPGTRVYDCGCGARRWVVRDPVGQESEHIIEPGDGVPGYAMALIDKSQAAWNGYQPGEVTPNG